MSKRIKISYNTKEFKDIEDGENGTESSQDNPNRVYYLSDVNSIEANLIKDLNNLDNNFIYYQYPLTSNPVPIPLKKCDNELCHFNHVILPFQEIENEIIYEEKKYTKWSLIKKLFDETNIENIDQFENLAKIYNRSLQKQQKFDILDDYLEKSIDNEEKLEFFEKILPEIIRLALNLPNWICFNLKKLEQNEAASIFLSQQQISSLLANAFLCTFCPDPSPNVRCINFSSLFTSFKPKKRDCKLEKLKCLINYFKRITESAPSGTISFERKVLKERIDFKKSNKLITWFEFNHNQCLLKDGFDYSQVDFANKYIGGGVLTDGCVQEEILFVCCPELIVSVLICDKLADNEAIIITGAERFNDHDGYAETFRWKCSFNDYDERDVYGRRFRQILAMDALYFHWSKKSTQYEQTKIDREICKAMAAFQKERFLSTCNIDKDSSKISPTIATGNWGCGVYNGDVRLKALIQILAASECERTLLYFTFNNINLMNEFNEIRMKISAKNLTVGQFYKKILKYANEKFKSNKMNDSNLLLSLFE